MIKNCDNIIGKNLILPESKLEILKWDLYKRRVPLKNLFEDFDKLNQSKIPKTRFMAILNNHDIKFSDLELQVISDVYKIDEEFVDYKKLINEVEKIRISEEEKKLIQQKCENVLVYKEEEKKEVNSILEEIANEIYLKRLFLKSNFKDFDKLNSGHISKIQFFRVLHKIMSIDIKKEKEDLLIRRYLDRDNTREMNYFKFLKDINSLIEIRENKENHLTENIREPVQKVASFDNKARLESVLANISRDCKMYGKDIRYFFKDYDQLRKNSCNVPKFKHCLSILDLKLTKEDYDMLVNEYSFEENSSELIDYKRFIADINKLNICLKKSKSEDVDFEEIRNYFYKIKHIQKNKNYMFKQFCQDFDKNSKGEVTISQFKRILNNYELLSQDPKETEKLIDYFRKDDKINYIFFLKKLDEIVFENPTNSILVDKFKMQSLSDPDKEFDSTNLQELFAKMMRIEETRKTIFDYHLRNFDSLNSGWIATSSFFSGFGVSGLILNFEDTSLLKYFYEENNQMNYKRFLQDYNLYKKPLLNVIHNEVTKEDSTFLNVMRDLKSVLDSRRIDLNMYFKNWDKFNRLKIPQNKFQQVLSLLNISLKKTEIDLILKRYQNSDDFLLFDYNIFLEDLDLEQNKLFKEQINLDAKRDYKPTKKSYCDTKQNIAFDLLVRKLKTQRIGLKNYLQDYDVLSKGYIKKEEFISVLDKIANISIIPNFELIPGKYELKENFLDYQRFLQDVKEYSKTQKYDNRKTEDFNQETNLTETEKTELNQILSDIRDHNKNHRLLWKNYFKDEDRSNRGLVFKDKVRSLLDRLGVKFTQKGFNLLSKAFSRNELEFDYLQFIRIID